MTTTKNKSIQSEWKTQWLFSLKLQKTSKENHDIQSKLKYLCIILLARSIYIRTWSHKLPSDKFARRLPGPLLLWDAAYHHGIVSGDRKGRWCFPSPVELQKLSQRTTSILSLSHVDTRILRTTTSNCDTIKKIQLSGFFAKRPWPKNSHPKWSFTSNQPPQPTGSNLGTNTEIGEPKDSRNEKKRRPRKIRGFRKTPMALTDSGIYVLYI